MQSRTRGRSSAAARADVFRAVVALNEAGHGLHPYVVTLWGSDVLVTPGKSRLAASVGRISQRAADMVMVNSTPSCEARWRWDPRETTPR